MKIKLLIIIVSALLSACGGGGSSSSGSDGEKNLIVVLGDSIGAGVKANIAFPDIIASLTGLPVDNNSTPGINAEDGVAKAQGLIDSLSPKYIVALLGTNNALVPGGSASGAINAMKKLARICNDNDVICIIGTIPPFPDDNDANNLAKQINSGYRGIGGVRIADNYNALRGPYIGPDGIHPNDEGQRIIGETFSARLP